MVKVYDTVEYVHDLIMVMEYCEGGNLLEWIERNRRHDGLNEKANCLIQCTCNAQLYMCMYLNIIYCTGKVMDIL